MRTKSKMILDFVGVGAGRSGTTWTAACLAGHPEICVSRPKELNYFSQYSFFTGLRSNWAKSDQWLARRFSHGRAGQLCGEFSPPYMLDPDVPARLFAHNPRLKIIFNFREPVARLYSLYFQLKRLYPVPDNFEDFLSSSDAYLASGFYAQQTARFSRVFSAEQMHYIFFDDIVHDPHRVNRELFKFLGVDQCYVPATIESRVNDRAAPRNVWLRNRLHWLRILLNSNGAASAIKDILARLGMERLYHAVRRMNLKSAESPPMNPVTRANLCAAYATEITDLASLTNRDLSDWLSPPR